MDLITSANRFLPKAISLKIRSINSIIYDTRHLRKFLTKFIIYDRHNYDGKYFGYFNLFRKGYSIVLFSVWLTPKFM